MVLVNYTTRELTAKLVFYGPGLCGKTTNLQYIFDNLLPPDRKGKMVSLNTETDRTLFFDFLPLEIGTIRGLKTRLQLYTVPGQVHYNATRKIVLKGADGIVFVADSQATARDSNIESYRNMKQNLAEHGLDLRNVPFVLQFNKRDLPNVMSVDQMAADLNEYNVPFWEAIAIEGIGVEDTLKGLVRLVMKNLAGRFQTEGKEPAAAAAPAPVAAPPPAAPPTPVAARAAPAPAWPAPQVAPVAPAPPPAWPSSPAAPAVAPAPAPWPAAPPPPPAAVPWPAAPAASLPSAWPSAPAAAAGPLELELEPEPGLSDEVLDLGEEQFVPGSGAAQDHAPVPALDDAFASGDTIFAQGDDSPASSVAPPAVPLPMVGEDLEAALLSGDTVMSLEPPPGLLTSMPAAPSSPSMDLEDALFQAPPQAAPPPAPAPMPSPAPARLPPPEPPGIALSSDLDLEDALLASPPTPSPVAPIPAPPFASPPAPSPVAPVPAAAFASSSAARAEEPEVIEVEATLQLGRVAAGETVRRLVRVPVEYHDASGARRTTLTVRLEFRVD